MLSNHLFIIFAIEHYNPLGVIRSLGEKGISSVYIAEKGKVKLASMSKYLMKCHDVDDVASGYQLLLDKYGHFDQEHKPFLYCTDDRTMGWIDERYEEVCEKFILFNAGRKNRINQYMDKAEILQLAKQCGLKIADTVVCKKGEIPSELKFPIITKSISPNIGGWKSDVFICKSKEELQEAYGQIKAPTVLLQRYIEKKNELEYYGFAINQGKDVFFSIAADYRYLIPGYYSPYMNIFTPPYPDMQEKVAEMIQKVGFEGIFSVEFIVDEKNEFYFLEINFRNATWSYASTCAGMNLPYLWAKSMDEGKIPEDARVEFTPFQAMVEPIDYGKRVDTGKISVGEWVADFKEAKCTYYYHQEDKKPYQVLCKNWDKLK